jgi:hypothetical protein
MFRISIRRECVGLFLLGGLVAVAPATPALAQSAPTPEWHTRSLTFDSRLITDPYSSDAIERFGVELLDLTAFSTGKLITPGQGVGRRVLRGVSQLVAGTFVGTAFGHAFHEFGHASRAAAAGFRPWLTHESAQFEAGGAPIRSSGATDSFFTYLGTSLFNRSGATLARLDRTRFPLNEDLLRDDWSGQIAMQGLNHEMLFAEALDTRIQHQGVDIGLVVPYVTSKLAARSYAIGQDSLNDITNIVTFYAAKGLHIDSGDIRRGSLVATMASANVYRFLFAGVTTLAGRDVSTGPVSMGPLELPSTAFFMNRSGLSYRVTTAVRDGAWRIPVSVERVYDGNRRTEVTVGAEHRSRRTEVSAVLVTGKTLEGRVVVRRWVRPRVALEIGGVSYDARNLNGARRVSRLKTGTRQSQVYLGVAWSY